MEKVEFEKLLRQSIKNLHGDWISEEDLDKKVKNYFEKRKNIKKAEDALHIQYLGNTIDESDFERYEEKLSEVGFKLSRFDESGEVKQSLDSFSLVSFILLNEHVFSGLYSDIQGNLKWDVIKFLLRSLYGKLKGKKYQRIRAGSIEEKEISFGLKVKLDKNTQFDFSFTNLDKETFNKSLDKILGFLEKKDKNQEYKLPNFVEYDSKKKKWAEINVMEEIKKKAKKQAKKKKK